MTDRTAVLRYETPDKVLRAAFQRGYRHDVAPNEPLVEDHQAKHFDELYKFDRDGASGAFTFLTEAYTSPFGLTHGTSKAIAIIGFADVAAVADGTHGGGLHMIFNALWTDGGSSLSVGFFVPTMTVYAPNFSVSAAASAGSIILRVTPGALDTAFRVRVRGEVFVATLLETEV